MNGDHSESRMYEAEKVVCGQEGNGQPVCCPYNRGDEGGWRAHSRAPYSSGVGVGWWHASALQPW
ncbi:MAG: hypothetical protein LCI00_24495 [Chloroflexi bacterium]|nr:hypothetical protein [Chloroflexota bacterium]MCC6895856.1 hypothetical protein [Anaerolineae bacterium]